MKVKELKNEGLERSFEVTLPSEEINEKVDQRLAKLAKTVKKPGFRPGKVPLKIVKKEHGQAVLGEILEHAVADSSQKVMDEREIYPAMKPKIEVTSFEEGKDLTYKLDMEIYPEVPEIDFKKITLEKSVVDITDKEVDDALKKIQEGQKDFEPLKKARAAKKGDVVDIDFLGKKDGEPFDGGAAQGHKLEIGSGQFIPGFEDQLIGAKKGEDKLVKVTFPKEYGSAELAGADVEFEVKVNDVLESKLPEINDDLAVKIGIESLDKLKEEVKTHVAKDFDSISDTKLKKELFDAIDSQVKFDVPKSMVDMEYNALVEQFKTEEKEEKEKKKQQEEFKEISERRVRLGVILADIGRKNTISVSEDELRAAVFEQARSFPGQEQQVIEFYQQNNQALEQLKGPILEDKAVDFVKKQIKITEKKVSSEELIKFNEEE